MTEAETSRPALERNHMHDLKCYPDPFTALLDGRKTCELRRDDRGYMVGHRLDLREFDPSTGYSGRRLVVTVEHIIRAWDWPGMAGGYVAMSIKPGRFSGEPPFDQAPARKDNWDAFRAACTHALELDVRDDDDILKAIRELRANGAEDARRLKEAQAERDVALKSLGEVLDACSFSPEELTAKRNEAQVELLEAQAELLEARAECDQAREDRNLAQDRYLEREEERDVARAECLRLRSVRAELERLVGSL